MKQSVINVFYFLKVDGTINVFSIIFTNKLKIWLVNKKCRKMK